MATAKKTAEKTEPVLTVPELFEQLGAPLFNSEWSTGVMHPDGTVYLLAGRTDDEGNVLLYAQGEEDSPARSERRMHIQRIRAGHPCYIVLSPEQLGVGGDLMEGTNGDIFIRVDRAIPMPAEPVYAPSTPVENQQIRDPDIP